jgi:hypothetical protein
VQKRGSFSPLKAAPLRNPGQSVEREIFTQIEVISEEAVGLIIAFVMTLTNLALWLFNIPPSIAFFSSLTLLVGLCIYSIPKIRRLGLKLSRLKQARDGERAVAEYLDSLKNEDCRVLHDVVGENFNLDHVIISTKGIYTIETKTLSKYNPDSKIVFDGDSIRIGNYQPPKNPIIQAKAQAAWLRRLLEESTGKIYSIRPVVVFPGWFIERTNKAKPSEVWALEPKALQGFIRNEPIILTRADIGLIVQHLKRHIRTTQ